MHIVYKFEIVCNTFIWKQFHKKFTPEIKIEVGSIKKISCELFIVKWMFQANMNIFIIYKFL